MNRLSLAFIATLALGCGPKEFGSVCGEENAPAACGQTCDPSPSAPQTCGDGAYCTPDGLCDAQCGGSQSCGDGYTCTTDGRCIDDGSGSGGPVQPDASCPAVNFTPMPTTPSIGLVLDQSGSMYDFRANGVSTDGDFCNDAQCRFRVMREALVGTAGVVTQLESKAFFGANLYTCNGNADLIGNVPRAATNAAAIRAAIDAKVAVRGQGTPTAAAINAMVATYTANPPPANSPPVIVLATDGEPNSCNGNSSQSQYNAESEAAAAAAFTAGIPVYVLAIGQNSTHFQNLANRGQGVAAGQPNVTYYPVNNAADLAAAFQTIINGVISCDLTLTGTIDEAQAGSGTVTVNGVTLTYGTDWILVGGTTIRVQGQACTQLKSTANPTVSAQFPCGSVIF